MGILFLRFLIIISLFILFANAVLPIHIKGFRFIKPTSPDNIQSENEVFYVNGIDYQPGGSSAYDPMSTTDVLSDPEICSRDLLVFQQLGINTLRIYTLNPDINHDECMTILNNAGIYILLDVNSGSYNEHLNRADPKGSYNYAYLNRVFRIIEAFKDYPNLLGFIAGNEVINDDEDFAKSNPTYIRSIQRDMKDYISVHCEREIPVGYAAANQVDLRAATFKYLQCNSLDGDTINEELENSKSDFFGLNTYDWCSGKSNWITSGYKNIAATFSDAIVPVFFSEYGCNTNSPRTFDEVSKGLFGGLSNILSGGLIYEYSQHENNYGLVEVDPTDQSVSYLKDFKFLQKEIKNINLPSVNEEDIVMNNIYKCDASSIQKLYSGFGVKNFELVERPAGVDNMIQYGADHYQRGKILESYSLPITPNYKVKDTDGKSVIMTISYDPLNLQNYLKENSTKTSLMISKMSFSEIHTSSKTLSHTSYSFENNTITQSSTIKVTQSFTETSSIISRNKKASMTTSSEGKAVHCNSISWGIHRFIVISFIFNIFM